MQRWLPHLGLVALLALTAPAQAQNPLDMNVDPVTLGWSSLDVGSAIGAFSGGILDVDCPALTSFFGYSAPAALWSAATTTGEWVVEASLQFVAQPATTNPSAGGLQIIMADGTRKFFLEIFTDKIELFNGAGSGPYTGTSSYAMDTTDGFHTYTLVVDGAAIDVLVDGTVRLSATNGGSSSQDFLQFGDLLYANATQSAWDYVSFSGGSVVDTESRSWSELKGLYGDSVR